MAKSDKKRGITIDGLVAMTQRGFHDVGERFDTLATRVGRGFAEVDERFNKMDERFEKLEFLMIGRHDKRLDKLEDDMRIVKTLLEKKLNTAFPR